MKFGRKKAVHNRHTMARAIAMSRSLDTLGAPPVTSNDYVSAVDKATGGNWGGVHLNDSLGDCVIADSANQVILHTANAGTVIIPTDQQCLEMYEAVGGYVVGNPSTDNGCDENAACQYLMTTGLCGQKSAGSGMIDPANGDHIRWSVQLMGACRLGIVVTQSMMDDFGAGNPWTSMSGNVLGGHDVFICKYDATYAYVVTWAKLQPVAWSLIANTQFLEEAHCEVATDFIAATGIAPSGFDLQGLLDDLSMLQQAS